ncbi:hypothetical protein FHX74_001416 [Friedmanniella endophytica]|uniref:Asp23 family, cell envelope-related function n=1 Tax=Microlunatus kandeliicorticis TaxID=1759536 RepID=A0A7W3IRA7_9ACTN|nr:hypothetical protein [Microlunatus kandeliicorticis]MBA8793811.1 hypothetical protein [Microlunatus kandeliicorticis]
MPDLSDQPGSPGPATADPGVAVAADAATGTPGSTPTGATAELVVLAQAVAEATLAVPGVARLEPTLRGHLRALSTGPMNVIGVGGLPDGVVLSRRSGVVEARIDVAVHPVRPADEIAEDVRTRATALITGAGHQVGRVAVAVLSVEV